jgi:putative ABC transport system permease protein
MKTVRHIGILRRAALFITRRRAKSIILLAILFVLITLVLTGISINSAAEKAAAGLREALGGYFKLETNWESREADFVTGRMVDDIIRDEGIKAYNG